ncbi:MAG TPA: tRNA (adenosine(37)-N6)-threonylcarbamoyltransferase complex ATPase subunit type 1 TsaE [Candidatus Parcubacteria bacterium]|nr:tRNA (adenosine(37)-N6)-threonylcarbamoyltransferase complex ATPase subunit type 1 TsaE [Candidatus Parcubacteria bacterium]
MKKEYLTKNPAETKEIGEIVAKILLKREKPRKKALVLALRGGLGSGKTTFVQGFAKGLGVKEKILSPTFVIFKKFKIKNNFFAYFYHIDCYRIKEAEELTGLGIKEMLASPKSIIAVEWPEKIKPLIPKKSLNIKFTLKNEQERKIKLENFPPETYNRIKL